LIGFLMGQLVRSGPDAGDFMLWDFFIDRRFQRRGFGRDGIRRTVELARSLGADAVAITYGPENPAAGALYRSIGFVDQGRCNNEGEHQLRLIFS
jgi:diamine N-acetyltransferase